MRFVGFRKVFNIDNYGLAHIPLIIGLLLMAVAMPVATKMVQETQDNRSSAAYNNIEIECPSRCSKNYGCKSTGKYVGIVDCDHPKVTPSYTYDASCPKVGDAGIAAGGNNDACLIVPDITCSSRCSNNYGCMRTNEYIGKAGNCNTPVSGSVVYTPDLTCPEVGAAGIAAGGNNNTCSLKWSVVSNSCNLNTSDFNCELKEGGIFDNEDKCKKSIGCGDSSYYCMPDFAPTVVCVDTRLPENGICEIGKIYEFLPGQFGRAGDKECSLREGVVDPNAQLKTNTAKNIAGDLALKLCLNGDTSVIGDLINALNSTGSSHNTNVDSYLSWAGNRDQCDSLFAVGWITAPSGYKTKKEEAYDICTEFTGLLKTDDSGNNKSKVYELMDKYIELVGGGFTSEYADLVMFVKDGGNLCSSPGDIIVVDVNNENNCKKCKANPNAGLSNFMCKSTLSILDLGTWVTEMANFNETNKMDWKSDMNCDGVVNALDLPLIKGRFTL